MIFIVDDGTGSLDCVVWHKESASANRIGNCLSHLNSGKSEDLFYITLHD